MRFTMVHHLNFQEFYGLRDINTSGVKEPPLSTADLIQRSEAETSTADLGGRMALHYASSKSLDMFWPLEGVNSTIFICWA